MIAATSATVDLLRRVRARYAPPPTLLVSEFADREIVVTTGPLAGTRWQTSFAPYQAGILDALLEPGVQTVVVKGSSQWGKTACAVNIVAYHVAHDPCPILVVEPTVDPMAKDFARNRLDPVIAASPILRDMFGKRKSKDSTNTTLLKTFRGGFIAIGGANSAASLAARPTRLLILDEIDRYPLELPGEGSTIEIAFKRTAAYRTRKRILMLSSPTIAGAPIDLWHDLGDQRRYQVPCPRCSTMHPYEWRNLKWELDDPTTAYLECPACQYRISEAERVALLDRGAWIPSNPDRGDRTIVSFHLWEAYSPLSSLRDIVAGFLRARRLQKAGDNAAMHTFENTTLGEAVDPTKGEQVQALTLIARREPYAAELPAGVCCVTLGIDTQDDRLEVLAVGWGVGEESWLVGRHVLPGDTSQPEPWRMLDDLLAREYEHESGARLTFAGACIDSAGHRTNHVYDYAAKKQALRLYAIIGVDGDRELVKFTPAPKRYGRTERKVALYTVGVDAAKALWMSRLKLSREADGRSDIITPGYVHVPIADWADEGLAEQLTSEKLVRQIKHGIPKLTWIKIRPRNEMLDCAVYALAALRLLNVNLEQLADRLAAPRETPPTPPARRDPWIKRPRGWFKTGR